MEYQKIANLLDDSSNKTSKFGTRNWIEINDESRGKYDDEKQMRFKTTKLKPSLCDYSDAYILVKGKITITGAGADLAARQADERNKGVAFKNCAPFTSCKSDINNAEIDYCQDIDIVTPMYNLIKYSDNYAKTSGSLWQYYRDEPNNNIADSESFKSKIKITGKTPSNGNEKDVEIMVPLKYLSNFWRTLEMPLINCEVSLVLTWSPTCVITNSTGQGKFEITDTNLYVPVVTLSTEDNEKLLQQLRSRFKRVINWNKYLSRPALLAQNPNLNYLIDPSFQGVNRLFVLAFENDTQRKVHSGYYLPNVEIKSYNVMINGENFFDQPIKDDKVTYENTRKIVIGKGDDYITACLLDYQYFRDKYKMIGVDLSRQQALDPDPRKIQQINFTANLDRADDTRVYFILESKETKLNFAQGTVKVL